MGHRLTQILINHEGREGHEEKNKALTESAGNTEDNFSVDTTRSLKSSTAPPTERKISKLVFLSVGISFVSRWLTIVTRA
jgi:hypothetical protein